MRWDRDDQFSESRFSFIEPERTEITEQRSAQQHKNGRKRKYALPKNYEERQEIKHIEDALDKKLVVVLYGFGGIGKTTLLKRLADNDKFEYTFIYEVKNKENFTFVAKIILRECFGETTLPDDERELMDQIFHRLETKKVLIVIDNLESIMGIGEESGKILPEYQGFVAFCNKFLETETQSRLIMSGREMLELGSRFIESYATIKMLGMDAGQARKVLRDLNLNGSEHEWTEFTEYYSGNPLELKIAAREICDSYSCNISDFLHDPSIPHELHELLREQFERFNKLEKVILLWCAVEREPVDEEYLISRFTLLEHGHRSIKRAFANVHNHCFVERDTEDRRTVYYLQPVIQEFLSERLVDIFLNELVRSSPDYFKVVPLVDTDSKEYILEIQKKLLVAPLQESLARNYGDEISDSYLKSMCDATGNERSYSIGNIISILSARSSLIENWDFSNRYVLNTDLRRIKIKNCDFRNAVFEHVLMLHTFGNMIDVKFSFDDKIIIGGATDYNLYLWDSKDLSFRYKLSGHNDWIRSVASNSSFIASGSNDQTIRVYDAKAPHAFINAFREENRVRKVVLPKQADDYVYSAGDAGIINQWNIVTGERQKFSSHTGVVWNFIVTQINHTPSIVSVSDDGKAIIWNVIDKSAKTVFTTEHSIFGHCGLRSVVYDDENERLFFGSVNGNIIVFSMTEQKVVKVLSCQGIVWSLDYDRMRKKLISASGKNIIIWNCCEECYMPEYTLDAHDCDIWNVYYNSNYTKIISTADDYCFNLWDATKYRNLSSIAGYTNLLRCVFVSENNDAIYIAGDDSVIREYKLTNRANPTRFFEGHTNRIRHVDVSADGRMMLSCSDDKTVILWNLETGEKRVFYGHKKRVWSVCFLKDQQFASAGEENDIYIWDFNKDEPIYYLRGHEDWIWDITYCRSNGLLASASEDKKCKLWDVEAKKELYTFNDHDKWLFGVSFDDAGRHIVTASTDGTANIYDTTSKEKICTLSNFECWVWSAIFLEDDVVAVGSQDGSVTVFKIDFGQKVAVRLKKHMLHHGWVDSLALSKKHKQFYSASADETVKVWSMDSYSYMDDFCIDKPYDKMRISNAHGLTSSELQSLRQLGAED